MTRERKIIIIGDTIREVEETLIAEAPLASLADYLVVQAPTTMPVLPYGAVYASYDPENNRGLIVVERQPKRYGLNVRARDYEPGRVYHLQLPYQYFFFFFRNDVIIENAITRRLNFTIDNSLLYWRKERFTDHDKDKFYPAKIMNVKAAKICWGNTTQEGTTLADAMIERVNSFSTSIFNAHYGFPTPDYGENLAAWEAASTDPLVYRNWTFWEREAKSSRTIMQIAADQGTLVAEALNWDPAFIEEPELPVHFTVGRAREWLNSLPAPMRRRMIAAIEDMPKPRGKDIQFPNPNPDNLPIPEEFVTEEPQMLEPPAAAEAPTT